MIILTEKAICLIAEFSIKNVFNYENKLKTKVPKTGFEPAHPFGRYHLKVVRLPISPPGLNIQKITDQFPNH
jgi:hypothetical protein